MSERGLEQAEAAAQALSQRPATERPTRVWTSPLRRCRETAGPFARKLGVEPFVVPAVAEIPTPAGVEGSERAPWLRQALAGDWRDIVGIDGPAWRRGVVEALCQAQGCAVFTHFVAINAAVTAATGSHAVLAFRPAPGSVTTLAVEDGRLVLVALGEALQAEGRVL